MGSQIGKLSTPYIARRMETSTSYAYKSWHEKKMIVRVSSWIKCLKNQPCDVIKIREMKGEVGKKTPKKEMDNPSFFMTSQGWFFRHFVQLLGVSVIFRIYFIGLNPAKITLQTTNPFINFEWKFKLCRGIKKMIENMITYPLDTVYSKETSI